MRVKKAAFLLLLPSGKVKHRFSGTENRTVGSDYEDRQVFGQSDTRSFTNVPLDVQARRRRDTQAKHDASSKGAKRASLPGANEAGS